VFELLPAIPEGVRLIPVRLATTCVEDSPRAIAAAVAELIDVFHDRNDCAQATVKVAVFTATSDLTSEKPAAAARRAGWQHAQLLCVAEMRTDNDVPFCLRALLLVERSAGAAPIKPVYLHGAQALRPDLVGD
jgi:monofunctional chorismate mutase